VDERVHSCSRVFGIVSGMRESPPEMEGVLGRLKMRTMLAE
jgi:hypothetical protein